MPLRFMLCCSALCFLFVCVRIHGEDSRVGMGGTSSSSEWLVGLGFKNERNNVL